MKYKKIVIFTKTLWDEPPRIRHQLTKLLLSYGHEITFFERSSFKQLKTIKYEQDSIKFVRHFELLHHQLRPFGFLIKINQFVIKNIIKKNIEDSDIDLIINFNYDYDFLRDLFPKKKVITIINDDFIAQAKFWMKSSIKKQLEKTCEKSDTVFTVHYSLHRNLLPFNKNTHILFPWAGHRYILPTISDQNRSVVLFWGYIDHRVDWKVIEFLLKKNIKLRFIGNIENSVIDKVKILEKNDNFELLPAMPIEEVQFSDIFCSIIPYNINVNGVKVISISNRTFQLLSYGIPIVHSALPDLIEAPKSVIYKCKIDNDYFNSINYFRDSFAACQPKIKIFLKNHYSDNRYNYFFEKIR